MTGFGYGFSQFVRRPKSQPVRGGDLEILKVRPAEDQHEQVLLDSRAKCATLRYSRGGRHFFVIYG